MAYSPIEQGRLLNNRALQTMAQARGVTSTQMAIAWLLHRDNVIVIPKSSRIEHVEQNYAALHFTLSVEELAALDTAFPLPAHPIPLEML
jgi:diketogulonate reductase-like aldo/keto reductase